jgi:hypothetical protein
VAAVFDMIGLAKQQQQASPGEEEVEVEESDDATAAAAGGGAKKRQRRSSGSSAGGTAERSMSQFAEVMSKFYTPPVAAAAAAASSSPSFTAEQWLADCMVSDEQRKALTALLPDPAKPFTLLILSSLDAQALADCDLKPFQQAAWAKLATKHA